MGSIHKELKARQRAERDSYPENLSLRVHRALSWLDRAEQDEDPDSRFIFLWIAFNAAYATEIDDRVHLNEQATFNGFMEKLCDLDGEKRIGELVWKAYPSAIRVLLDNPYVFSSFWDHQKGYLTEAQWKQSFDGVKKAAHSAVAQQNTPVVLSIVFIRIYTLRNQIMHGGATWNGSVNREQIRDCVAILADLVPVVIEVIMDNPGALSGEASCPVVWYERNRWMLLLTTGSGRRTEAF